MKIIKYVLSKDNKGLLCYFGYKKSDYYHIHSKELSTLERWIKNLLKNKK